MIDYPWTAAELYELVKDLPVEARPGECEMVADFQEFVLNECYPCEISHAVALHESAVLRWYTTLDIYTQGPIHGRSHTAPGEWFYGVHYGPTFLHALVAAAKAVGK